MNLLGNANQGNLNGASGDEKKQKYPGHLKLMQDLKSIRAKIEVLNIEFIYSL